MLDGIGAKAAASLMHVQVFVLVQKTCLPPLRKPPENNAKEPTNEKNSPFEIFSSGAVVRRTHTFQLAKLAPRHPGPSTSSQQGQKGTETQTSG